MFTCGVAAINLKHLQLENEIAAHYLKLNTFVFNESIFKISREVIDVNRKRVKRCDASDIFSNLILYILNSAALTSSQSLDVTRRLLFLRRVNLISLVPGSDVFNKMEQKWPVKWCVCAHAGWLWDHGGDVCELCPLLPTYPAGAVQESRRPGVPAEILQHHQQVLELVLFLNY